MRTKKYLLSFFLVLSFCLLFKTNALASSHEAWINDEADLLSDSEETLLLEDMEALTDYGNVIFLSTDSYSGFSTAAYAHAFYQQYYGNSNGLVFYIDMYEREILIDCNGDISYTLHSGHIKSITDNVYRYASNGDYYSCAANTFNQCLTVLEGGKIAQPMKHINNVILALILAFIINYYIVRATSQNKKASSSELVDAINHHCRIFNTREHFTNQTRKYSPTSSGSSGGSHGGGGHSGGGGGGHSSGGHHF